MKQISLFFMTLLLGVCSSCRLSAQDNDQVKNNAVQARTIEADYNKVSGRMSSMYNFCVGAGRAEEGLRADWQQQLSFIKKQIGFRYIRFHGLLNDEMHVYTEDKEGNPVYNWQYVDKLYDFLLHTGIRPFVELGFMPPALASGTKTVFWWKGNVSPPKSYEKWAALITALVRHFEERYGRPEVEKWYFEVWNEPDLGGFFAGTREDYFKLYQVTAAAIKSVSPSYRVGGPATARNIMIPAFLKFCADHQLPLDFISTHCYNTKSVLDEKGTGRKRMLAERDYMVESVKKTRRIIDSTVYKNRDLHYTEFNSSSSSRDPIHDTYQNAAWLLNTLKSTEGIANSMSYWTFTDIFEEAGPAVTPFHGGFGLLNLQGIKKPTFFAYRYMHELGETQLNDTDRSSWVCKSKNGIQVLFWNMVLPFNDTSVSYKTYFNKIEPAADAGLVTVHIRHIPEGTYDLYLYRTGDHHNDAYSAYLEMGAPSNLSRQQEAQLKKITTGDPVMKSGIKITDGNFSRRFRLRENDIYLIKLVKV